MYTDLKWLLNDAKDGGFRILKAGISSERIDISSETVHLVVTSSQSPLKPPPKLLQIRTGVRQPYPKLYSPDILISTVVRDNPTQRTTSRLEHDGKTAIERERSCRRATATLRCSCNPIMEENRLHGRLCTHSRHSGLQVRNLDQMYEPHVWRCFLYHRRLSLSFPGQTCARGIHQPRFHSQRQEVP